MSAPLSTERRAVFMLEQLSSAGRSEQVLALFSTLCDCIGSQSERVRGGVRTALSHGGVVEEVEEMRTEIALLTTRVGDLETEVEQAATFLPI
jgi:hypothetical protein